MECGFVESGSGWPSDGSGLRPSWEVRRVGSNVAAAVAEIRKRLGITQVALARLCGVHPMTISRWERGELQVGLWHRQLLLALVSAQPRDNLEQRLSDANSNPVLILAHLLNDSISPNASQHLPFVPPPPSLPLRLPASRQTTAVASRRLSGTALELAAQAQAQPRRSIPPVPDGQAKSCAAASPPMRPRHPPMGAKLTLSVIKPWLSVTKPTR